MLQIVEEVPGSDPPVSSGNQQFGFAGWRATRWLWLETSGLVVLAGERPADFGRQILGGCAAPQQLDQAGRGASRRVSGRFDSGRFDIFG